MREIIEQKLAEIEEKENIRILHCVESGSRAWGFASPDSDYDVRFIYLRPREFYLRLEKTSDVIEWQLDETLDINGWDVQKALRLLHKSNPTLFEWNSSPIVYKTTRKWKAISDIIDEYFMQKHALYHYLSTAKSNYREYLKGEIVKLKKYFYVLRPLLACKWILKKGTPPPMRFDILLNEFLSEPLKSEVETLIALKTYSPETKEIPRVKILNDYMDEEIAEIKTILDECPADTPSNWDDLDKAFLSLFSSR